MIIAPAGYSDKLLAKKLGIKKGFNIMLINAPDYYFNLFTDWPTDLEVSDNATNKKDLIHFFTSKGMNI
jgi:hypothetical protein